MNLIDWQNLAGCYWGDRESRLKYALQHTDHGSCMGHICAIQLLHEIDIRMFGASWTKQIYEMVDVRGSELNF